MGKYEALNEKSAVLYVRSRPELQEIFRSGETVLAREIGDGNINMIYEVYSQAEPERSLLIKQALPTIRLTGWPLTLDRMRIEARYYAVAGQYVPRLLPKIYVYDPDMALIVMENLNRHLIMRKGLIQRRRYPRFAEDMGHFLAQVLYHTSDLHLDGEAKKALVKEFINPELCKITENLVFTEPYIEHENNHWNERITPQVRALRADQALKHQVRALKEDFFSKAQALIHGDLHTGSVMLNESDTRIIDPEFAFFGPAGFDIGAVIGNLLLSYASHEGHTPDVEARQDYQAYLLDMVVDMWENFAWEFANLWAAEADETMPPSYRRAYLRKLLQDTAGFAGAKMMRRIIGLAHVIDLESIEDEEGKARAMSLGLRIGQRLVLERESIADARDLVYIAATSRPLYPFRYMA